MKYGELTLGDVEAIVKKLGGIEGVRRFLSGESVERQLQVWKTIKLGTGLKTAEDFCRALRDGGFMLSDQANDILGELAFTVADEETEVDLVQVTPAALGFEEGSWRYELYERAEKLGLALCPVEVGPQLRLQYQDQPNHEWIFVAMEPIIASSGRLGVFRVGCDDSGLWLGGSWGGSSGVWNPGCLWVFLRPRK